MDKPTLRLFDGYAHTTPLLASDVRMVQSTLGLDVDGRFGTMTEIAVIEFQRDNGLVTDGIVGPKTWSALLGRAEPEFDMFDTDYQSRHRGLRQQAAESDKWFDVITEGAMRAAVPIAVVWAIGSRESHWGLALEPTGPTGTGDFGHGRGLMQIDDRWHKDFIASGKWVDPVDNILYGCDVLRDNVRVFRAIARSNWLRCSLAAYNCGMGNVRRALTAGRDVDYYTASRNYSADVLSRAGWFQRHMKG